LLIRIPRYRRVICVLQHHTASCGLGFRVIGELSVFCSIILPIVDEDSALSESYRCFAASHCLLWIKIHRYRRVIDVSEHHTASCGLGFRVIEELSVFRSIILPPELGCLHPKRRFLPYYKIALPTVPGHCSLLLRNIGGFSQKTTGEKLGNHDTTCVK